jgi:hypothetical protein
VGISGAGESGHVPVYLAPRAGEGRTERSRWTANGIRKLHEYSLFPTLISQALPFLPDASLRPNLLDPFFVKQHLNEPFLSARCRPAEGYVRCSLGQYSGIAPGLSFDNRFAEFCGKKLQNEWKDRNPGRCLFLALFYGDLKKLLSKV